MIAISMAVESAAKSTELDGMPEVPGVEHRFVDANGLRMHVAEAGEGEPVVMLHGWPQHWYEWRHLIPPLAERYRVICPDLRGLGWTDAPPAGYEKENLATDVLALLDAIGVDRFRLVGHDWGGWAGYLICLREPERVERYLALNIYPPFVRVTPGAVRRFWRFWYQWVIAAPGLGPWVVRQIARGNPVLNWIGVEAWTPEDREAFLSRLREPARARASSQYYRSFQLREVPAITFGRYRRTLFPTPTRLLVGTEDRVQPPEGLEGAERGAVDLTVELVPGVGHFIADEVPDLVRDRALDFFGSASN
jgi:pimeloyl-ACP methyl ester carboxylesterase